MIIVGDPGHGGTDPGAVSAVGAYEKDINLAVALLIEEYLKPVKEIQFYLTRRVDEKRTLAERCRLANNIGADLLISIHCNASATNKEADWMDVYCYKFGGRGEALARAVAEGLHSPRAVRAAPYYMLRDENTKMPAALAELGFLSNAFNAKKLAHPDYQKMLAKGICQGLCKMAGAEFPDPDMSWKERLIKRLVDEKIIDTKRDPEQPVLWWELASVVGREMDRK